MTNDDVLARLSRRGFLTLTGAVGLSALAACAGREEPTTGPSALPSGFGGATDWQRYSGTTLSVLLCEHWWTSAISAKLAQFEELSGMRIDATTLSEDSYYQQALVALSSGASTYDAVMVGNLQAGQYMQAGWLSPLDEHIHSGDVIDSSWFDVEDFFAPALAAGSLGGEQLALPISAEAGVIMFRRSLLEAVGVSSFETQESLVDAAAALQGSMDRPFAGRGRRGLDIVWTWTNFLLSAGGDFYEGETPVVNSPEGVAATELYVEQLLRTYGPSGASNMSWLEATGQVNEGNAALFTDASGLLAVVLDDEQSSHTDDIAVQRWPGSAAAAASPNYWYWLAGVPSASQNKEAAALFYAWAMSPEVSIDVSSESGSPSARQSVWEDERFLSFYPDDTADEIVANLAAVQPERVPYARPSFPQEADALGLELVNILSDGKGVQRALDDAVAGMREAAA